MARPRFHKLNPERQHAILTAAAAEFAHHGYLNASLNRIIDQLGLSKGAMYYYFDGKEELYKTIMDHVLQQFMEAAQAPPNALNPEEFWTQLEAMSRGSFELYRSDPICAALIRTLTRDLRSGGAPPSIRSAYLASFSWFDAVLEHGQKLGAIRTDLPWSLLSAIAYGFGEALDVWVAEHWECLHTDDHSLNQMAKGMTQLLRQFLDPALNAPVHHFQALIGLEIGDIPHDAEE